MTRFLALLLAACGALAAASGVLAIETLPAKAHSAPKDVVAAAGQLVP